MIVERIVRFGRTLRRSSASFIVDATKAYLEQSDFWSRLAAGSSKAGTTVTADTAMRLAAVYACVRVLSETLATVPLKVYRRLPNGGKSPDPSHPLYRVLHDRPNDWQNSFEWREMMMGHLVLRGNAYSEIVSGIDGPVSQLIPLHPDRVRVERKDGSTRLQYFVKDEKGVERQVSQDRIFHLRGLSSDGISGMSPISAYRNAVGLAMAAEDHGSALFRNGARPGIVFSSEQPIKPEQAQKLISQWNERHQGVDAAFSTGIMPFGLKPHELGMSNEDAQFLETRKYQATEIARIFRVPPHMIGDLERSTFANIEQQSKEFLTYTMMPWFRRWQHAIQTQLIPTEEMGATWDVPDIFAEFVIQDFMHADAASRASFFTSLFNIGVITINDILTLENMNPIGEQGDVRFVPANMMTLERAIKMSEESETIPAEAIPEAEGDEESEPDPSIEDSESGESEDEEMPSEERASWIQRVDHLQAQLSEALAKIAGLSEQCRFLDLQLQDARSEVGRLNAEVTRLTSEAGKAGATAEVYRMDLERVKEQNRNTSDSLAACQAELEAHRSDARRLNAIVRDTEAEIKRLNEKTSDAAKYCTDLIHDTATRLIGMEFADIRRLAKRKDFTTAMDSYYEDHRDRLSAAMRGPCRVYDRLSGLAPNYGVAAVERHVIRAKQKWLDLAGVCTTNEHLLNEIDQIPDYVGTMSADLVRDILEEVPADAK